MRLPVPFVESRIVDSVLIAIIGLPLRSSKNSSIEMFFGRPSALVKRSSSARLLPAGRKNQRISTFGAANAIMLAYLAELRQKSTRLKSLLLYTIALILKTRPARLCRLFEPVSLKKGIIFPLHTQDVKIDSLLS